MKCEACERGEHHLCGMQTWCECPCDGTGSDPFYIEPPDAHKEFPDPHSAYDYASGGDNADSVREMYRDEQDSGS